MCGAVLLMTSPLRTRHGPLPSSACQRTRLPPSMTGASLSAPGLSPVCTWGGRALLSSNKGTVLSRTPNALSKVLEYKYCMALDATSCLLAGSAPAQRYPSTIQFTPRWPQGPPLCTSSLPQSPTGQRVTASSSRSVCALASHSFEDLVRVQLLGAARHAAPTAACRDLCSKLLSHTAALT